MEINFLRDRFAVCGVASLQPAARGPPPTPHRTAPTANTTHSLGTALRSAAAAPRTQMGRVMNFNRNYYPFARMGKIAVRWAMRKR